MKTLTPSPLPILIGSFVFFSLISALSAEPTEQPKATAETEAAAEAETTKVTEEPKASHTLVDAPLNELFELLAEKANLQYYHNPILDSDEYLISGELFKGDPIANMEKLASPYGLKIHVKQKTVWALTEQQISQFPKVTAEQAKTVAPKNETFTLRDAPLNDVFELLAEVADLQYFHNRSIDTDEFLVTGRIFEGDPIANIEQLSFLYGLETRVKGKTLLALTEEQISRLPKIEALAKLAEATTAKASETKTQSEHSHNEKDEAKATGAAKTAAAEEVDFPVVPIPGISPKPILKFESDGVQFISFRDAPLNNVFEMLAKELNRQYFHNPNIDNEEYLVRGRLLEGNPIEALEQLGALYSLEIRMKRDAILVLTEQQALELSKAETKAKAANAEETKN